MMLSYRDGASGRKDTQKFLSESFENAGEKAAEKIEDLIDVKIKFLKGFATAAADDQNPVFANAFRNRTLHEDDKNEIIRTSIIFHAMTEGEKVSIESTAKSRGKPSGKTSTKASSNGKKAPARKKKASSDGAEEK